MSFDQFPVDQINEENKNKSILQQLTFTSEFAGLILREYVS